MKVLILGLGSIAKKHIEALKALYAQNLEMVALRSSTASLPHPDVADIYQLEDVKQPPDFVLIATPTMHHAEAIAATLPLGTPLFIEKPVLGSLEKADELAQAIAKANVYTYVACNFRFHAVLTEIKDMLRKESIGKINEVNIYCGSDLRTWRPNKDYRQSYSARKSMGGGVHLDLIHEIDYTYWLFGKPEQVHALRRSRSHLEIDAADYANYQLVYPGFVANIVLNYYRADYKRTVEVVGESGTLEGDLYTNTLRRNKELIYQSDNNGFLDTYEAQMRYFTHCLEKAQSPMNNFDEGVEVLKICLS